MGPLSPFTYWYYFPISWDVFHIILILFFIFYSQLFKKDLKKIKREGVSQLLNESEDEWQDSSALDFNVVAEIYYVNEFSDHESSGYILDEFSPNQE